MKIEHSTDRVDETTYKFMLRPRDFSNLICLRNTKLTVVIFIIMNKITPATSCLILPLVLSLMSGKQTVPRCPPNNQGSHVSRHLPLKLCFLPNLSRCSTQHNNALWQPAEINAALSILGPTVNQANELCSETPPQATLLWPRTEVFLGGPPQNVSV